MLPLQRTIKTVTVDTIAWQLPVEMDMCMMEYHENLKESLKDLGPSSKAILPTEICNGYARVLKDQLQEMGLDCFRMRYMRLKNKNYIMPFHRDRVKEEGAWRLHIPIFTNINCIFQWKSDNNKVHQVHLPADGRGHLVRVDIPHRALNNSAVNLFNDRVHFICDIHQPPNVDKLSILCRLYQGEPGRKNKDKPIISLAFMQNPIRFISRFT